MITSEQGLISVGRNSTTTSPLRVSSVAKPRTREANTGIKHKSKQASIDMQNRGDPNPLMWAEVYER